ncbi:MAG TPA: hypothetical protein DDY59_05865 [Lachnospiraceae bacterium]|jgi:leader peptidase (prepilin peptidase)/N-methyltransferase|nr:hypothetical protein [Lachnospiraceae bacterium]HCR40924.1 hypothetical protein [Lachnospiraceae bacterium]
MMWKLRIFLTEMRLKMAETGMKIIIGVLLLLCSIQDVRRKKLSLWVILTGAVLIGICMPFSTSLSLLDRFGGVIVGVGVIGISLLTGGKIGMGDGLLLCVTGIGLGFWGNMELFAAALAAAAVVSILLLVFRLANRKKSIPFVPFLLFSFLSILVFPRL